MPNRKVVMEESKQDKMNTLIAKEVDKVIDLSRSQTKVILNNSDRITDINKTIKFILGIQLATLIVVTKILTNIYLN